MLDQLFNLVNEAGQDSVVNNPQVPNQYNQQVLADATSTIAGGLQNVMAGGGFQNILDVFKGNNGIAGLMQNPMVSMMIGHFISKLVNKYQMSPAAASQVANQLIPTSLNNLISRTNSTAPEHEGYNLNSLIGSMAGGKVSTPGNGGDFDFQGLLNQFTGGNSGAPGGGAVNLQDIINQVTSAVQQQQGQQSSGGGLMDMIKGFIS